MQKEFRDKTQSPRKQTEDLLSDSTLSERESGQDHVSDCPEFLRQTGLKCLGGLSIEDGGVFSDFYPSSTFPRGGGIFVLVCFCFFFQFVFILKYLFTFN